MPVLKKLFLILTFLLILPGVAFAGLADDLKESQNLVLAFGGQWAQLKAAEMKAAWNIYDKVKEDRAASWFSIGDKWAKTKELWKAKDELKLARERVKQFERDFDLGKVRDTGKELFDRAMLAVGIVGHFNKDVKAFHVMVTAGERLVETAHHYREASWWQFTDKVSRAHAVLNQGKRVLDEWKTFKNTGGGRLIQRVVDFAKGWGGILGGGIFNRSTSRSGRIPMEIPTGINPSAGTTRTVTSASSTMSADDETQTVGMLREQAYKRMTEALGRNAGIDELKQLKEEFDLLDGQYQRLKSR